MSGVIPFHYHFFGFQRYVEISVGVVLWTF